MDGNAIACAAQLGTLLQCPLLHILPHNRSCTQVGYVTSRHIHHSRNTSCLEAK